MSEDNELKELISRTKERLEFADSIKRFSDVDYFKDIIVFIESVQLVRDSDKELLKIAYAQLQDSSSSYDSGCNIIRKILEPSPPKQP